MRSTIIILEFLAFATFMTAIYALVLFAGVVTTGGTP
jgi:hypothetical protein